MKHSVNPITCFVCCHGLSRHRQRRVGQAAPSSLSYIMQFFVFFGLFFLFQQQLRTCCLQRKKNPKTSSYLYPHFMLMLTPPANRKIPTSSEHSRRVHFSWPGLMSVRFTPRYSYRGETEETGLCIYLSPLTSAEPPPRGK